MDGERAAAAGEAIAVELIASAIAKKMLTIRMWVLMT